MKIKNLFSVVMTFALLMTVFTINSSAAGNTSFIIDNDTVDSTCTTQHYGFNTYITGNSHYNRDCRRALSSDGSFWYEWSKKSAALNSSNSPIYVTAGVYLNNTLFTDPQARYYVQQRDGGYLMGYINQNTAPAGWSYLSYAITFNYAIPGAYSLYGVSLGTSGIGNGYTGADAIRVSAYCN